MSIISSYSQQFFILLKILKRVYEMNIVIKSFIFNVLFYGWTFFCLLAFVPLLICPGRYMVSGIRFWVKGLSWINVHVLNLHFEIVGLENLPSSPFILASKHQSAWETFVFHALFDDIAIVFKKELMWIPFFGWYLRKSGAIPLSRSRKKGPQSLKKLLTYARSAVEKERPILIFPEGTRSHPGQAGTYRSGVASLYLHLNVPVVPIALNSGLYWPRRSFRKYPGTITVAFLDPIKPGLSRQNFMKKLKQDIESKTQMLVNKG